MRRVGSKMASDKMSQWAQKARNPDRRQRCPFTGRDRGIEGNRRNSRYLPAFAANPSAGSRRASFGIDLETDFSRSASMKRRPESGVPKGEGVRGATKRSSYELQAASDKWVQVARRVVYMDVAFTWSFQLEACRSIAHHFSKGCTHKRQAIALYRCPAIRSALAYAPDDHGEWSVPVGSGWCHK